MEEERVNFNIAKMAKMNGFITPLADDTEVHYYYLGKNSQVEDTYKHDNIYYGHVSNNDDYVYEAPTLSALQTWIRKNHGVDIVISPVIIQNHKKYIVTRYFLEKEELVSRISSFSDKPAWCMDHESALRLGLIEAMVQLKKKY